MNQHLDSQSVQTVTEFSNSNTAYQTRLNNELKRYRDKVNVHDLPSIHHYWSRRYLSIYIKTLGYKSIKDIYFQHCRQAITTKHQARFCSIGAGNCNFEVDLVKWLVEAGFSNFTFKCIDVNQNMLERGNTKAKKLGLDKYIQFQVTDLNSWSEKDAYHVILAIQCLHHFVELETIFQKIFDNLESDGYFITHDMIGKNGHQRWTETLKIVRYFWQQLPPKYKLNHRNQQIEESFINRDFSQHDFEGIRAQDILPLLDKTFNFELFVFWGGVIDPFISRAFGHNYDPNQARDKAIIDRIQKVNEDLLIEKAIKPTQMVATMRKQQPFKKQFLYGLSPSDCIRKA